MPTDHQASRTLVKSPPELWAECSDAGSLARHIGEFGEIRITRLEPETSVAWEGEHASGTVQIEPSGWGTRVTLTAQTQWAEPAQQPVDVPPESIAVIDEPVPEPSGPPVILDDPRTEQEERDAKVEETLAEPDPAVEAEPDPPGGRWKRLKARTRSWLRSRPPEPEPAAAEGGEPSVPPPEPAAMTTSDRVDEAPGEEATADIVEDEPAELVAEPGEPPAPPELVAEDPQLDAEAVLLAALDSLGQAHHRPFSRA